MIHHQHLENSLTSNSYKSLAIDSFYPLVITSTSSGWTINRFCPVFRTFAMLKLYWSRSRFFNHCTIAAANYYRSAGNAHELWSSNSWPAAQFTFWFQHVMNAPDRLTQANTFHSIVDELLVTASLDFPASTSRVLLHTELQVARRLSTNIIYPNKTPLSTGPPIQHALHIPQAL